VEFLNRPCQEHRRRRAPRTQVEIVETDLVGVENGQQAVGNGGVAQDKAITVPRLPQGAHGLEQCPRRIHKGPAAGPQIPIEPARARASLSVGTPLR
jgi:hypothetical protein